MVGSYGSDEREGGAVDCEGDLVCEQARPYSYRESDDLRTLRQWGRVEEADVWQDAGQVGGALDVSDAAQSTSSAIRLLKAAL